MSRICKFGLMLLGSITIAPVVCAQEGSRPQVPIPYRQWLKLKDSPEGLAKLGATLPPVAAESKPNPGAQEKAIELKNLDLKTLDLKTLDFVKSVVEVAPSGAWSNLANVPPGGPYNFGNPLLLTDGTVIVHRTDTSDWYKLTPSNTGSYVNGTWTQIASMQTGYGPKFFASAVLPDGRFIAEGGEYNLNVQDYGTRGSIYDPTAGPLGTWTPVSPPAGWTTLGDGQSAVLVNGTFMVASCCDQNSSATPFPSALFNPGNLSWTGTGSKKADRFDEESWTLLPDGTVLTVDAYTTAIGGNSCGRNTERYNPSTGSWSSAGNVPAQLGDCDSANAESGDPSFEIGPQVLMYNGKVIAFGGTTANVAHTALYDVVKHSWAAGPDLPSTCSTNDEAAVRLNLPCTLADAPATLLPNGNVLVAASAGKFHTPAAFFEYDPTKNNFNAVPGTSDAAKVSSFYVNFLTLPTGQVLAVETYTSTIQIYTPSGTYLAAWQPGIATSPACVIPGSTYPLSGTQLNGLSQSTNYGDDQQAATNYPLVRIVNNVTGHVSYARTFGHSTMTVAANAPASTKFKVAAGTESGASKLYVVANGIPSAAKDVVVAAACPVASASTVAPQSGDSK
jgi:hypothetical protein